MADLTIYGGGLSPFVRAPLMVCIEKGVDYDNPEADIADPAYRAQHPFARVPSMRHGDFTLFESSAIMHYIDDIFDGPALQPADRQQRALQDAWMSAVADYVYRPVLTVVIERFVAPQQEREPDQAVIDQAVIKVRDSFAVLDETLGKSAHLSGGDINLADFGMYPQIFFASMIPDTATVLKESANLSRWFNDLSSRESAKSTQPQLG